MDDNDTQKLLEKKTAELRTQLAKSESLEKSHIFTKEEIELAVAVLNAQTIGFRGY